MDGSETSVNPLPGPVWVAIILSFLTAIVGLFFPLFGWLCTLIYGVGAFGLLIARPWAYWLVIIASGLSFVSTLMAGRFVFGSTLLILILLITPSARETFGIGATSQAGSP